MTDRVASTWGYILCPVTHRNLRINMCEKICKYYGGTESNNKGKIIHCGYVRSVAI